jgi:hypothetical protein
VNVVSPSSGVSFIYYNYPNGAAFSPPSAVILPGGTSSPSVVVNKPGFYQCMIRDNNSQCTTTVNTTIVLNDILSQVGVLPTPPSCSTCCDGTLTFSVPASLANNFSVSASSGTINGNPPTSLSNLCYGSLYYTLYNTQNNCNLDGFIQIDGTVGLSEKVAHEKLIIYPNPSNGNFVIKNLVDTQAHIIITTLDGQLITNFKFKEMNDLCYLSGGVYILTIKTTGSVLRKKLIIDK